MKWHGARYRHEEPEHPFVAALEYQGVMLDIEHKKGGYREGVSEDGVKWRTKMPAHYGEVRGTVGADGDAVDVFVGPHPFSPMVYVVQAKLPGSKDFDETKSMLGYNSKAEAMRVFRAAYDKPGFVLGCVTWPFGAWAEAMKRPELARGMLHKPIRKAALVVDTAAPMVPEDLESDVGQRAMGKGKKYPIGHVSTHSDGSQWKKGPDGWKEMVVVESTSKKVASRAGKIPKKEDQDQWDAVAKAIRESEMKKGSILIMELGNVRGHYRRTKHGMVRVKEHHRTDTMGRGDAGPLSARDVFRWGRKDLEAALDEHPPGSHNHEVIQAEIERRQERRQEKSKKRAEKWAAKRVDPHERVQHRPTPGPLDDLSKRTREALQAAGIENANDALEFTREQLAEKGLTDRHINEVVHWLDEEHESALPTVAEPAPDPAPEPAPPAAQAEPAAAPEATPDAEPRYLVHEFEQHGKKYRAIVNGDQVTIQIDRSMPFETRTDWVYSGIGRLEGNKVVEWTHVGPSAIREELEAALERASGEAPAATPPPAASSTGETDLALSEAAHEQTPAPDPVAAAEQALEAARLAYDQSVEEDGTPSVDAMIAVSDAEDALEAAKGGAAPSMPMQEPQASDDLVHEATPTPAKPTPVPKEKEPATADRTVNPEDLHKDVGEVLYGARKHLWVPKDGVSSETLVDIEAAGDSTAKKHVTRNSVYQVSHDEDHENGVSPGCSYLKKQLLAQVATKPAANATSRRYFVEGLEYLGRQLDKCETVRDVEDVINDFRLASRGMRVKERRVSPQAFLDLMGIDPNNPLEYRGGGGGMMVINVRSGPKWEAARAAETARRAWIENNPGGDYSSPEYRRLNDAARETRKATEIPISFTMLKEKGIAEVSRSGPDGYLLMENLPASENIVGQYALALTGANIEGTDGEIKHEVYKSKLGKVLSEPGFGYVSFGGRSNSILTKKHSGVARNLERADDWSSLLSTKKGGSKKKRGQRWTRSTTGQRRVGGPSVDVSNVTGEQLMESFGFRGVQHGNWVNQQSREYHMARAVEAFTDLADVIGIPPKALTNGGALGLAFGARGNGRASAHYEPDKQVINLTHTNGAGSIAHEWGHFMDHQITEGDGWGSDLQAGTLHPEVHEAFTKVMHAIHYKQDLSPLQREHQDLERRRQTFNENVKEFNQKVRAKAYGYSEQQAARAALSTERTALNRDQTALYRRASEAGERLSAAKPTDFARHAKLLGNYWADTKEMFARAFESYVEDTLIDSKRLNTYLVEGTRGRYNLWRATAGDEDLEPYPHGDERKRITEAMGGLVKALASTGSLKKALERMAQAKGAQFWITANPNGEGMNRRLVKGVQLVISAG